MNKGISFSLSQQNKTTLLTVFKLIHAEKYKWLNVLSQTEAWHDGFAEAFDKETYSGEELLEEMSKFKTVLFLKLQAFEKNLNNQNIENFVQFKESDCQMLLLIYDGEFAELYIKDALLIDALYKKLPILGCFDVDLITDQDDFRSSLNVR